MPAKPTTVPPAQTRLLAELGERLRRARLRRGLTAATVAGSAGITRATLHRLETGEAAVTLGTAIKVMGVLGLAGDVALLLRDDPVGRDLQDQRLPARRAGRTPPHAGAGPAALPARIRLGRYPQLRTLAWHLPDDGETELTPQEAFELYERNWRHLDADAMEPGERALVRQLTRSVGKGVLLV